MYESELKLKDECASVIGRRRAEGNVFRREGMNAENPSLTLVFMELKS